MSATQRAVPIDIGVQWEAGAPMPHLLIGLRTFLLFYAKSGGGYPAEDRIGLLEIVGCAAARYGPPNDEALDNHPLWGRGLGFDAAHQVEDSAWLPESHELALIKGAQASALPQELRHFIFTFHDETVEVLARDLNVEVFSGSMTAALQEACRRLA